MKLVVLLLLKNKKIAHNVFIYSILKIVSALLTTQDFDAGCMQVVLRSNEGAHSDDKEIPKAGDEGHHPDGHPQNQAG